jgi:hypothetical protein
MLDATWLTVPRWTRAPLSCNRCGVPARVDAASRSGCASLLPSHTVSLLTALPHLSNTLRHPTQRISRTSSSLCISATALGLRLDNRRLPRAACRLRVASFPRIRAYASSTASIRLSPVPRNRRVPPMCLPHLRVLRFRTPRVSTGCDILVPGRVWLVPGATRSCSASRTLRTITTRRMRALCSFSLLRRLCA